MQNLSIFSMESMVILEFLAPGALGFGGFTHMKIVPSEVEYPEITSGCLNFAFRITLTIFCLLGVKLSETNIPCGLVRLALSKTSYFIFLLQNLTTMLRRSVPDVGFLPSLCAIEISLGVRCKSWSILLETKLQAISMQSSFN